MPEVKGKVVKTDSRDEIYNFLRGQILSLAIEPGEMFSENSLSPQMSVSRALVRDAPAWPIEEGHTVVYPQRGTVVTMIDSKWVKQSVCIHIVLEQAVIEGICRQGLTLGRRETSRQTLAKQKEITGDDKVLGLLAADEHLHYLLSTSCDKEHIWGYFRAIDYDLMRVNHLQHSTFNPKAYISSLTRWEYTQVGERLLIDNTTRGDAGAVSLIRSNHFNTILWNMGTLQRIYPQFFPR